MVARAAFFLSILTLLLGGCGLSSQRASKASASPEVMPLTADNVSRLRQAVDRAKAVSPRPAGRDNAVRYARAVYVAAVPAPWSATATTEAALTQAKAGNDAARQYLTIMVYDLQLQTAMEGEGFSAEDWKAIYVGAGIMSEPVFLGYAALSRSGKALP